ncbi:MAG: flavodoxin [Bacilli bacterium]|nr:flavodoxin [Bacilli bacterium]
MEIAIRYYSKLGHTKDIAQAMAEEAGVTAVSIADESSLQKKADILFLGGAPYANVMDKKLRAYAEAIDPSMVSKIVLFTTSNWSRRTVMSLRRILERKGIEVEKRYFYAHMLNIQNRIPKAKEFIRSFLD